MALIRWDVFSKFKQGKQVINHLWIAKGIGADNELYVLEVNPATGGLPITFSGDTDWGVVGAGTLRTAAQIGNATGAADFNAGTTGAQTLRTASNIYGSGGQVFDMGAGTATTNTLRVAADTSSNPQIGRTVVTTVRNDYASVNVTTGAWVQLVASLSATVNMLDIFDSSGQTMEIGIGAAASETRLILDYPGGNGQIPVRIASGTRVSIRAVSATANGGEIDINFLG